MSTTTVSPKKYKAKGHKKKKSFPWLGLILVVLGLASILYFIDRPDINKISKAQQSSSFLGSADETFKN
jgi:uncharacterized protein (DUF486 family)